MKIIISNYQDPAIFNDDDFYLQAGSFCKNNSDFPHILRNQVDSLQISPSIYDPQETKWHLHGFWMLPGGTEMSYGDEILRIPTLILEGLPGYVYSLFNNALANQH